MSFESFFELERQPWKRLPPTEQGYSSAISASCSTVSPASCTSRARSTAAVRPRSTCQRSAIGERDRLESAARGVADSRAVAAAAGRSLRPIAELIVLARRGDERAIGQIVESARALLLFTATRELPERLTQKVGVSDVVQETALEVQRGFDGFQGKSEAELFAWMRRILRNNIADAVRHYEGTAKRQVSRERSLDDGHYGRRSEDLPARKRTPDESVMRLESAAEVAEVLDALSPVHREVLHLRYWEQCTLIEIGIRMNRSPEAARKLCGPGSSESTQTPGSDRGSPRRWAR